jgi:hypothetical protein
VSNKACLLQILPNLTFHFVRYDIFISVYLTIKIWWHIWASWLWKMEALQFFITSVHLYQTTRRHIPEDGYGHLHWHWLDGLQCLRNLSVVPQLPPAASSILYSYVEHVQCVGLKWGRGVALLILNICITWIWVGNFIPTALPPIKKLSTDWKGGCVGPTAGVHVLQICCPCRDSNHRPSSPQHSHFIQANVS